MKDKQYMKQCTKCKEYLPETDEYFYKQLIRSKTKENYYVLQSQCKKCIIEQNITRQERKYHNENLKEYYDQRYQEKREPILAQQKEYNKTENRKINRKVTQKNFQKNNPDKLKQYAIDRQHKNHKISNKEWESCKKYFNHRCAYCGLAIEEHWIEFNGNRQLGDFHKEHVDHDGENDLSNCVPSCKYCNSEKHNSSFEDWYNENNPKFSQERLNKIYQWLNEDYQLQLKEYY